MSEIKRRIEDRRIELGKRRSDADVKISQHNETPWCANGHAVYMGADGGFSLRCSPNPEANASHIVNCVNNHEKLVEVLREFSVLDYMSMENAVGFIEDNCHDLRTLLAALEAEKGGEV